MQGSHFRTDVSLLTEAEHAYSRQRQVAMFAKPRELRRVLRATHKRAENGCDLAKARLKAIRDEYTARGLEPPRV